MSRESDFKNAMLPRRRRTGSESENLIVVGNERSWTQAEKFNRVNSSYPNNVTEDYYLEDHIEDFKEPDPIMTARDRTSEFVNTIQTLQVVLNSFVIFLKIIVKSKEELNVYKNLLDKHIAYVKHASVLLIFLKNAK